MMRKLGARVGTGRGWRSQRHVRDTSRGTDKAACAEGQPCLRLPISPHEIQAAWCRWSSFQLLQRDNIKELTGRTEWRISRGRCAAANCADSLSRSGLHWRRRRIWWQGPNACSTPVVVLWVVKWFFIEIIHQLSRASGNEFKDP